MPSTDQITDPSLTPLSTEIVEHIASGADQITDPALAPQPTNIAEYRTGRVVRVLSKIGASGAVLLMLAGCASEGDARPPTTTTVEVPAPGADIQPKEVGGLIMTGEYESNESLRAGIDYTTLESTLATIGEPKPQTSSDVREVMSMIYFNLDAAALVGVGHTEEFQEAAISDYPVTNIITQVEAVQNRRDEIQPLGLGNKVVLIQTPRVTDLIKAANGVEVTYDLGVYEESPGAKKKKEYENVKVVLIQNEDGEWQFAPGAVPLPKEAVPEDTSAKPPIYEFGMDGK